MPAPGSRDFDVVLLGATGVTGRLTAAQLAAHGPRGLRWAIAGRDPARLDEVATGLTELGAAGTSVTAVVTDVTDDAAIRVLAERTRVLATTVGPYSEYGDPVVGACAAAGTDYADLTGEPGFVDRTWLRHHARARETGARLVHACGFDSIPADLGAWYTVNRLPDDQPIRLAGYVRAGGSISDGTYRSAVLAFSQMRANNALARQRRELEPRPTTRRITSLPPRPGRSPDGRGYVVPLPTIDPVIVRRSARALDRYGPDFSYAHFALLRSLPMALAAPVVLGGVVAVAQVPWGRDLLLRRRGSGAGPSVEERAKSWFRVRFYGEAGSGSDKESIVTQVSGGDPGYDETSMMLAQSALCLAFDRLPDTAGQLTTAQAMGDALLDRIRAHGLTVRVVV